MNELTYDQVRNVVGAIDNEKLAAIVATGANLKEIIEGNALAIQKTDIVGQGETAIRGPVMEVYIILTSAAD